MPCCRDALRGFDRRNAHRAVAVADEHDRSRKKRTWRHRFAGFRRGGPCLARLERIGARGHAPGAEDVIALRHVGGRIDREQGGHEAVADRREALQLEAMQRGDHVFTNSRRRLNHVRMPAEGDDADAHVLGLQLDELQRGGARRVETRRWNVGRRHAERYVDQEHHGALLGRNGRDHDGTCEREQKHAHTGEQQRGGDVPLQTRLRGWRLARKAEAHIPHVLFRGAGPARHTCRPASATR